MGKTKANATDEILTVAQAAAFLQVEESTLRAETEAGRVPAAVALTALAGRAVGIRRSG